MIAINATTYQDGLKSSSAINTHLIYNMTFLRERFGKKRQVFRYAKLVDKLLTKIIFWYFLLVHHIKSQQNTLTFVGVVKTWKSSKRRNTFARYATPTADFLASHERCVWCIKVSFVALRAAWIATHGRGMLFLQAACCAFRPNAKVWHKPVATCCDWFTPPEYSSTVSAGLIPEVSGRQLNLLELEGFEGWQDMSYRLQYSWVYC